MLPRCEKARARIDAPEPSSEAPPGIKLPRPKEPQPYDPQLIGLYSCWVLVALTAIAFLFLLAMPYLK